LHAICRVSMTIPVGRPAARLLRVMGCVVPKGFLCLKARGAHGRNSTVQYETSGCRQRLIHGRGSAAVSAVRHTASAIDSRRPPREERKSQLRRLSILRRLHMPLFSDRSDDRLTPALLDLRQPLGALLFKGFFPARRGCRNSDMVQWHGECTT